MLRLAVMIWILVGTVLAGTLVVVVLLTPSLATAMTRFIPIAGIGGYVLGIPFAYVITGKILATTRNRPA